MALVLLPRTLRYGNESRACTWPPAARGGTVLLKRQSLSENLIWTEAIQPQGASSPWAPAVAFQWKLEAGEADAIELLRLALFAEFLGLLSHREVLLKMEGGSLLQRTLARALPAGFPGNQAVVLLEWTRGTATETVGGSLCPIWPFFPTSSLFGTRGVEALRRRILEARGPDSAEPWVRLSGSTLTFLNEGAEQQFKGALKELAQSPNKIQDTSPWQTALARLAGNAQASVKSVGGLGLLLPATSQTEWECAAHKRLGGAWSTDASLGESHLSADQPQLLCAAHHEPLTCGGEVIPLDQLGAGIYFRQGGRVLVLWKDVQRHPDLQMLETGESSLLLGYRRGHGPRIRVSGISLALTDVKCRALAIPAGPDSVATSTLPVKAEYLDLIENADWLAGTRSWRLKLKGRRSKDEIECADPEQAGGDSGVVVWPRESPHRWRTQTIGVFSRADQVAIVERLEDGQLTSIPPTEPPVLYTTQKGRAAYVTFHLAGEDRGAIPIPSAPASAFQESSRGLIAIDFGTSSSTVLYGVEGATAYSFVTQGTESARSACILPAQGSSFPDSLVRSLSVFSGWYRTPAPSPLLGTLLVQKLDSKQQQPIRSSVVPRERDLIAQLREEPRTRVFGDLKWEDLTKLPRESLQVYLERILLPAFHALAQRGVSRTKVGASYPLAFESNRRAVFKDCLETCLKVLESSTGVAVEGGLVLVSESHAGVAAISAVFADYTLTIDMGGGTTDIAVIAGDKVLGADSLRIGGRALLATLCATQDRGRLNSRLNEALGIQPDARLGVPYETVIETLLQSGGTTSVAAAVQPNQSILARQACGALLGAVLLASARLLDTALPAGATGEVPTVNVVLLGQGWQLLDPLLISGVSQEGFLELLREITRGRCITKATGGPSHPLERKLTLARGTMKLLAASRQLSPDSQPAFLGMELKVQKGTLSRSTPLGDVEGLTFVSGDPGFEAVIEELLGIIVRFRSPHASIGDPKAWLEGRSSEATGLTRRQVLVAQACTDLSDLVSSDRALTRSPLTHFLSNAWRRAWLGAVQIPQ